jgi:hypothetical protein
MLRNPRGPIAALFLIPFAACLIVDDGDDDAAGSSESGSTTASDESGSSDGADSGTTGAAGLEIVGEWTGDFMDTHSITETQWVQTYATDSYTYTIDHNDNDADVLVAQSNDDMTWARFDWTHTDDGTLWYCQTGFQLASAEEADATPRADDTDPATAGCGGFAWSALHPG